MRRSPIAFKLYGILARERRRGGACRWQMFEDPNRQGRFFETCLSDSMKSLVASAIGFER